MKRKIRNGQINDYLSVRDEKLFFEDEDLEKLSEQHGAPLEIAYLEIIKKRIRELNGHFADAIKKYKYEGSFHYAYASKANYYSEVVTTVLGEVDFLETTSSYDLDIVEALHGRGVFNKESQTVICNGFKFGRYFDKVLKLKKAGFNIIPVIESMDEYESFAKSGVPIDIGLRIRVTKETSASMGNRLSSKVDSRFGLNNEEMDKVVSELVAEKSTLTLKLIHFHLGGTVKDINQYAKLIGKVSKKYFEIKKKLDSLKYFDIGGGLPVQYSLDFDFKYSKYAEGVIHSIKFNAKRSKLSEPEIIGEYGRYTVNDHGVMIFEAISAKKSSDDDVSWYLLNGSLMNCLPDSWALGQDFLVLPINGWGRQAKKVKLGGITCDPDDTYYKEDKKNYLYLPDFDENNKLYVGFFGIGAYQEMISGVGGVHHCLLPEGNELIISQHQGETEYAPISKLQSPTEVLKILDYHRHHKLDKYL